MKTYDNFKDNVRILLDKIADLMDYQNAGAKQMTYEDSVCSSLDRIGTGFTSFVENMSEALGELSAAVQGIDGLPTVTADDNGKMLVVYEGVWTAMTETEYDAYLDALEAAANEEGTGK